MSRLARQDADLQDKADNLTNHQDHALSAYFNWNEMIFPVEAIERMQSFVCFDGSKKNVFIYTCLLDAIARKEDEETWKDYIWINPYLSDKELNLDYLEDFKNV